MSSGRSAPQTPVQSASITQQALLTALLLGAIVSAGAAEPGTTDSGQILDKMAEAHDSLEYGGVFTYEHGGVLKSVRVAQLMDKGQRWQHLLYLNGPRRELLREGAGCDRDPAAGGALAALLVDDLSAVERYYHVQRREDDRIADRAAWTVHLLPRDDNRYGYALSVDQQTGLLLQSLLIGGDSRVLERFQFVDVETPLSAADREQLVAQVRLEQRAGDDCSGERANEPLWQAQWLPPGFSRVEYAREKPSVERALYSDGLSVFSVFVDAEGGRQLPEVQALRGATVVQLARFDSDGKSYTVCVVGEIPADTAHRIATSVKIPAR